MTTCLGNGISLPHARVASNKRYIFAIGRTRTGIRHEGTPEYQAVRMVFLLLVPEKDKQYLNVLASLARVFRDKDTVDRINAADDIVDFRSRLHETFSGISSRRIIATTKVNRLMVRMAERVAKDTRCSAILLFGDTFLGGVDASPIYPRFRTVLVTRQAADVTAEPKFVDDTISVRSFSSARMAQLRSAVLIGLTRGVFKVNDHLCCIGGVPGSNQLDTFVIVDVEREFQSVLSKTSDLLPPTVKFEVAERILAIATELALEGREGKPVGCAFVLGDMDRVQTMTKQLILNPFHGYSEMDRNILNPFMDETIKELASIDGAFLVRGNGVVEAAGAMLQVPPDYYTELPPGLGTRHSAAAAISRACNTLAVVVSASGTVTLFRRGAMIPLIDKSESRLRG